MILDDVHRGIQKNKKRKRIGRGTGSGHGKTSGRGHKGVLKVVIPKPAPAQVKKVEVKAA